MPKTSRAKFLGEASRRGGGGGNRFSDWKKRGETTGFVHPKLGVYTRYAHGSLPSIEENKDGQAVVRRRRPNCIGSDSSSVPNPKCPTCLLQEFSILKIREGADSGEVILEAGGGKDHSVMDLADLAGDAGYMSDPKPKQEIVFAWIEPEDVSTATDLKKSFQIITGPQTLGERMFEVIQEQVQARGEIHGDVEVPEGFELKFRKGKMVLVSGDGTDVKWSPYPIKLKFRKDQMPAHKYAVTKVDRDLCELTPEIAQVMVCDPDELGVDFEKMCQPTEVIRQMEIIQSTWVSRTVPYEEFKVFVEEHLGGTITEPTKDKEEARGGSKGKQSPPKNEPESKTGGKPAQVFCSECGAKNSPSAKFCAGCGAKLGTSDSEPEKKAAVPKDEKEATSDEVSSKGSVRCPDCGEMVVPMKPSNRCPDCGELIKDADVPY